MQNNRLNEEVALRYEFLKEEEKQKLLMFSIEWVDLPCFLFYNFGFILFCLIGFNWLNFVVLGLSLWAVRFLWSKKLNNSEFVNVDIMLFFHKVAKLSNFLLAVLIVVSLLHKSYLSALFFVFWKIPISAFMQFLTPVPKPSFNDYAFLIYKTMVEEEMKKYKKG